MILIAAVLYCYVPTVPVAPSCGLTYAQCQRHIFYASRGSCQRDASDKPAG
jgi:hypothetical protein